MLASFRLVLDSVPDKWFGNKSRLLESNHAIRSHIHNEKHLYGQQGSIFGGFLLGYWDHNTLCNRYHNSIMERDFHYVILAPFFH